MASYLSLDIRRSLRDIRFVLLVVGWPVAAYLLFSTVFSQGTSTDGLTPKTEIMVAMACFGAMGAVLSATGPRLAVERQIGWLRQLRLTPLSPSRMLASRVISALALTVPAIALTFLTAALVGGVRLPITSWIELAALITVGSAPFAALGVVIGSIAGADSAQGFTMVVYLVLAALGGLWMPAQILPAPLRTIAHALPSNALGELGWHVAAGQVPAIGSALLLVGWLAGAGIVAALVAGRLSSRA